MIGRKLSASEVNGIPRHRGWVGARGGARFVDQPPDAVGIFPNRDAIIRLVGAVLAEQTDEWAEGRRYLGLEVLTRSRATTTDPQPGQETDTTLALTA